MSKLKANKQELVTPFQGTIKGETWTITDQWMNSENEVVWYDGFIIREGIKHISFFSPEEVEHDQEA